jgi:hypothetical protein
LCTKKGQGKSLNKIHLHLLSASLQTLGFTPWNLQKHTVPLDRRQQDVVIILRKTIEGPLRNNYRRRNIEPSIFCPAHPNAKSFTRIGEFLKGY